MDYINKIICGDSLEKLKEIPEGVITNIITSPPYNLQINYSSYNDDLPYKEYLNWLKDIFKECYRVLRTGGRAIINIDAMTNRQEDKQNEYIRPIYADVVNFMKDIGYKFYGEHIWYKSSKDPSFNGGQFSGRKTSWGSYKSCSFPVVRRNHEFLIVFSKEQFRLEKTSESLDSDITSEEFQKFIASTWSMHPETRKLGDHPVPFTEELPYRCIKLYSYPNDIILDPFNGTGTTTYIASVCHRRYIGIDIDQKYCEYAENRIKDSKSIFEN